LGLKTGDAVIGYLGSFFYFSGLPQVLESLSSPDFQDANIKFLLVGGGEQENELRQLVLRKGLSDKVIFTGYIDFSQIPTYLSLFDVGINPMVPLDVSNFALPNKVIQYLAMGVPVVSTRLDGLHSSLEACKFVNWVESPGQILAASIEVANSNVHQDQVRMALTKCVAKFEKTESSDCLENFLATFCQQLKPR
jgi:glycosyltransferase involved in cell wall biosynthesis